LRKAGGAIWENNQREEVDECGPRDVLTSEACYTGGWGGAYCDSAATRWDASMSPSSEVKVRRTWAFQKRPSAYVGGSGPSWDTVRWSGEQQVLSLRGRLSWSMNRVIPVCCEWVGKGIKEWDVHVINSESRRPICRDPSSVV